MMQRPGWRRVGLTLTALIAWVLLLSHRPQADGFVYEKEKLTPGSRPSAEEFGKAVSISDDGNVALVVSKKTNECGIAHIYARSGQTWVREEAQTLPPNTPPVTSSCSSGVLSGDGKTVLVSEANNDMAWVLVRDANAWTLQATLTKPVTPGVVKFLFSFDLALSQDGNTALIGSYGDSPCGVAFAYQRQGGVWNSPQEITLSGFGCQELTVHGLALSGNGTTALIGVGGDNCLSDAKCGAVRVFVRSGTTWTQQQVLSPGPLQKSGWFGRALALSDDGQTAVVGAPQEYNFTTNPTSAYVYTRAGTSWSLQQQLPAPGGNMGVSVDVSADGNIVLLGVADYPCLYCSQVLVFSRVGTAWSQQQVLDGDPGTYTFDYFGAGRGMVSMSSDAGSIIVGAPAADPKGAAWVFTAKCHGITSAVDPDCFELPQEWVEVGCEIIDCCPMCPLDSFIDWIIRVDGDPVQAIVLRFENLDPRAARGLRIEGDAKWIGPDRLQVQGRNDVVLRGFRALDPKNLRRSLLSPRMTLGGIERGTPSTRAATATSASRNGVLRIRVEQRIGSYSIASSTLVYRLEANHAGRASLP